MPSAPANRSYRSLTEKRLKNQAKALFYEILRNFLLRF